MRCFIVIALSFFSWVCLPASAIAGDLTFEDRVKAQEAIERVYYSHQVGTTKPFEKAIPRELLEHKVRTYLRQTVALETIWRTPLTSEALQHELRRIVRSSHTPGRLEEIFLALGHDAFLIQECFVRPVLANRLARNFLSTDMRFQGGAKNQAEDLRNRLLHDPRIAADHGIDLRVVDIILEDEKAGPGSQRKADAPEWDSVDGVLRRRVSRSEFERLRSRAPKEAGEVGPLIESPESLDVQVLLETSEDSFRIAAYAVRKASWDDWWKDAKQRFDEFTVKSVAQPVESLAIQDSAAPELSSSGCVADDTWVGEGLDDPPVPSSGGDAVWTGNEMLTWGGSPHNSAARYDPLTDTWGRLSMKNAPLAGYVHAVWTGSEMIVWGGADASQAGRYDPVSDTWKPVSTVGAPTGGQVLIWTGTTMIVWGGWPSIAGGRYDPVTDTWSSVSTVGAPGPRGSVHAVWSGEEMIVWGGYDGASYLSSGGRYDPTRDSWTTTSTHGAPSPRDGHTSVWAGKSMIVWGGYDGAGSLATGARYDPQTDTWTPVSVSNAPPARSGHTATWSGSEMLIWGGFGTGFLNTGARYDPGTDLWGSMATTNAPAPRSGHVAIWTGTLLLVWGGGPDSGGRYDPANDSWTPAATSNRPTTRSSHSAVWTGSRMIIWGGTTGDYYQLNSGASYDPLTAAWTPISALNAPSPRSAHVAVWTGSVMVVWGGDTGELYDASGGRYDPLADAWSPTNAVGSPSWNFWRVGTSAVWTGSDMIVWGGRGPGLTYYGDGARYDPVDDRWAPVSLTGAPSSRAYHTAVWTGSAMLVWGGFTQSPAFDFLDTWLDDGYAYLPGSDSWTPLNRIGAPSPRENHTAVWTGQQMLIWGGDGPNGSLGNGAAYDAHSDVWEAIAAEGAPPPAAPAGLFSNTVVAIWARPVMIVWGVGTSGSNIGGRYDTTTRTWKPVTDNGAPTATSGFSAVWTGEEMIVWGVSGNTGSAYQIDLSPDADLDGFTVCAGDCDDANPMIHPGVAELCNGLDDDCDGQVDEGFGLGTSCVRDLDACHQVEGTLACNADGTGAQCTGVTTLHDLVPPAIECPAGIMLECPGTAANIGQASASDACDPAPVITRNASGILPLGTMMVDWTATDVAGNQSSCLQSVDVVDTTPPTIEASVLPSVLWPPNHRMVDVTESVVASDACGTPTVSLISVESTEPADSAGNGDGDTTIDIQDADIGTADFNFALRAEREGSGEGRVYEVTFSAEDGSGNKSSATSFVFVPHDQGGATEPLLLSVEDDAAGTLLKWESVPGALFYRLVRGSVSSLRDAGEFIDLGTVSCIQSGSQATSTKGHEDADIPPVGEAYFYVAAYNDGRESGYGTETAPKPRIVTRGGCEKLKAFSALSQLRLDRR